MTSKFFNTFGYVLIRDFWSKEEVATITEEFATLLTTPGLRPCFADSNYYLASLTYHPKIVKLMEQILGPTWLYKGSDGNIFNKATPWHRDYLVQTLTCKLLTYLDENTLDVIPGSHHIRDEYCRQLGSELMWPESGGFHKGFLPPYIQLLSYPGDIIVFNHCLIHRTSEPKGRVRRLFGLHFTQEFNEEMRELTLIEMRTFNVPKCYGSHIPNNPHTAPFFELENTTVGKFDGQYTSQPQEAIDFARRLR